MKDEIATVMPPRSARRPEPFCCDHRSSLIRRSALPTRPSNPSFQAFLLQTYCQSNPERRQAGGYVGSATRHYELVINLKTAKARLEVPPTLLARADEVIE
jgi:hypothetical protein